MITLKTGENRKRLNDKCRIYREKNKEKFREYAKQYKDSRRFVAKDVYKNRVKIYKNNKDAVNELLEQIMPDDLRKKIVELSNKKKANSVKWKKDNPKKIREYDKKYRDNHKDIINEKNRLRYAENREKYIQRSRKYYNINRLQEYKRRYYRENAKRIAVRRKELQTLKKMV